MSVFDDSPTDMTAALLAKTEAGHQEIRGRALALSRPARTLLVLADGSRNEEQLLQMVKGASAADLQSLVDAELLVAAAARKEGAAPAASAAVPVAVSELGYQELYDCLNALCKEQLGLMRGFKYALEIEKADGIAGLREVATRFVADVRRIKGDPAAQMVTRALGITL